MTSSDSQSARAAIRVADLTKRYGAVVAVQDISFEIEEGSVTGLLGGNGAGKTTTIAMLMGLVLPSAGEIRVLGVDIGRHRHRILHRVNFESPYVDMPMRLTVRENLAVFARLYGLDLIPERIADIAGALDLTDLLDRPAGKLSAGQKTRASLAKALINMPEILFLDEPTASLDPDTADWVRGHIETYRSRHGVTILLASHNMPEVERLCDRVLIMKEGRIVDDGAPRELLVRYGRATLEDVFLDVARGTGSAGQLATN